MQRIFVIGGAGFIGSHTVDLLLANDKRVVVLDNLVSGKLTHLDLFNPNLEFIKGDLMDYPTVYKHVQRCDAVLHLAAVPSVPKSIEDPIHSMQINLQGFLHVLQAIREKNQPVRLVYASSAAVYGESTQLPCIEESAATANVLSPYALEKATGERYAHLYEQLFKMTSLGLRYFNVYGDRQDPKSPYSGVISKFVQQYQGNEPITIFGDGRQSRDFISVKDVARANVLALQSDYCGALNVATGTPETLLNLISYIEKAGGKKPDTYFMAARSGEIAQSYAAVTKAEQALGFRSTISLEQGIQSLLEIEYH